MPYYHVYISHYDKTKEKIPWLYVDLDEKYVKDRITTPYAENKKFFLGGRVYDPQNIDEILVLWSKVKYEELSAYGSSIKGRSVIRVLSDFFDGEISGLYSCTDLFISAPPLEKEKNKAISERASRSRKEAERGIVKSATFLGLDANWFSATSALQLQEVAITLLAQKKGIFLDRESVEKVLKRKVQSLSFNEQYEAFSKQVKDSYDVDMPILTGHLRKMRAMVLHGGYNPKPEETQPIIDFTIGLLQKLKNISERR